MIARSKLALVLLLAGCTAAASGRQILYEGKGDEPVVIADEANGTRTLRFGRNGAIQSATIPGKPGTLVLEYTKAAMVGLAFAPSPARVLVIGLGGGTMPAFLHHHFPGATIDAVEIDPEVLQVARRFFEFREDERLRAHIDDGRRFVERTPHRYDLIFLDAYGPDSVPRHLATREFLALARERLAPGGVVVANLWDEDANALYRPMVRAYQVQFPQVWELEVKGGNRIVVGAPTPRDRASLLANAGQASTSRGLGLDLPRMAAEITNVTVRPTAVPPLADPPPRAASGL